MEEQAGRDAFPIASGYGYTRDHEPASLSAESSGWASGLASDLASGPARSAGPAWTAAVRDKTATGIHAYLLRIGIRALAAVFADARIIFLPTGDLRGPRGGDVRCLLVPCGCGLVALVIFVPFRLFLLLSDSVPSPGLVR
jgi:hypothetical protein